MLVPILPVVISSSAPLTSSYCFLMRCYIHQLSYIEAGPILLLPFQLHGIYCLALFQVSTNYLKPSTISPVLEAFLIDFVQLILFFTWLTDFIMIYTAVLCLTTFFFLLLVPSASLKRVGDIPIDSHKHVPVHLWRMSNLRLFTN